MTPDEAADLAERTLAAMDEPCGDPKCGVKACDRVRADRERVASDLAGIEHMHNVRRVVPHLTRWLVSQRHADNLRRTAALYGVTA